MPSKETYNIKTTAASTAALQKAKELGLRITSGYRDPEHNKKVGGAPRSYHLFGQAYDVAGDATAMQKFYQWAKGSGLFVEAIDEKDHIHVAWKAGSSAAASDNDKALKIGLAVLALVALIND